MTHILIILNILEIFELKMLIKKNCSYMYFQYFKAPIPIRTTYDGSSIKFLKILSSQNCLSFVKKILKFQMSTYK